MVVERNVLIKILFVNIYFIFQTNRIRGIQYSQFGIKMFTSGSLAHRLKLGAGQAQFEARLHYECVCHLQSTLYIF